MPTIKLTNDVWNDREYEKIKSVLYQALGGANKDGCDASELKSKLDYVGLDYYTGPELLYFKNRLIDDGVVEEVGATALALSNVFTLQKQAETLEQYENRVNLRKVFFIIIPAILQIAFDVYALLEILGII